MLSFSTFYRILTEDPSQDVAKLQADIAAIDAQLAQRSKPLLDRKQQLQKMLVIKQKQANQQTQQTQQNDQGSQQTLMQTVNNNTR